MPAVESLSQKSKIFASSLWQGSLLAPGIVLLCDTGLFQALNRQRGKGIPPKTHNPKRGQRPKPTTRAKAKGQSRMVPPGGFLRGEQFERERVVPPLSRLLCFLSCRSKKGRPPAGQADLTIASNERSSWLRYPPASTIPSANRNCTARWLPQSRLRRASSLPEGAMGFVPCHIGLCL